MTRYAPHAATLAISVAALLFASCTAMLGDDFEISTTAAGGHSGEGGSATGTHTGTSTGSGGTSNGGGSSGGSNPCGNGEPDPGELCDGDCPEECIDGDLCTSDTLVGSADDCDAHCPFEAIDTCVDNDGCCPNGCYNSLDNDCSMRVGVLSAYANGVDALSSALDSSGEFGSVDVFPVGSTTPTLTELQNVDAVIVTTNYDQFHDPTALGNVLADYYDQGGRVVLANGANCSSYAIGGRFVSGDYLALDIGNIHPTDDPLGTIHIPNTPLMDGSAGFVAYGHCDGAAASGAVTVASYQVSGDPLVAYRWVQGRRRVDLNIFPPPDSGSEGLALVINALKFQ